MEAPRAVLPRDMNDIMHRPSVSDADAPGNSVSDTDADGNTPTVSEILVAQNFRWSEFSCPYKYMIQNMAANSAARTVTRHVKAPTNEFLEKWLNGRVVRAWLRIKKCDSRDEAGQNLTDPKDDDLKYWPVIVTRDITEWDGKLYVVGTCPGLVMQHAHMWYMNITRLWLAVEPRIWHDMEPRNVTGDYLAAVRALTPISAASQHPPGAPLGAPLGAPPGPEPGPPPGAPPAADGGHQHQPPPPLRLLLCTRAPRLQSCPPARRLQRRPRRRCAG